MGRKSVLVPAALEVLKEYTSKITIRQLFYRLVSRNILKNSEGSYNVLIQAMINSRRDGRIPFEVFEDRTRHSVLGEHPQEGHSEARQILDNAINVYENAQDIALEQMKVAYREFELPLWYNQSCYVEVWLEKEALSNLFEPITGKYGVTFVPCRGYPSLSLLYDCAKRLKQVNLSGSFYPPREIRILYFGDFDMRGLNIQENVEQNLLNDFGVQTRVIRYALTKEQIQQYQLPPNPAKSTDTMAKGWIEKNGNVAWELDALEPPVLENLVETAIREQLDPNILGTRHETIKSNREWLQVQVQKYLTTNNLDAAESD
jgi:hypothetical protein